MLTRIINHIPTWAAQRHGPQQPHESHYAVITDACTSNKSKTDGRVSVARVWSRSLICCLERTNSSSTIRFFIARS